MLKIGQRIKVINNLSECEHPAPIGATGTIIHIRDKEKWMPDHIYGIRLDGMRDCDYVFLPDEIVPIQCYPELDRIQLNFYEE